MNNYLAIINIQHIISADKEKVMEFFRQEDDLVEITRGYYAFVEHDKEDQSSDVVTIVSSLLHDHIQSRIVIYITAKDRKTAEKYLNYFATERLATDEVQDELDYLPHRKQIAASLGIKLDETEFEIL